MFIFLIGFWVPIRIFQKLKKIHDLVVLLIRKINMHNVNIFVLIIFVLYNTDFSRHFFHFHNLLYSRIYCKITGWNSLISSANGVFTSWSGKELIFHSFWEISFFPAYYFVFEGWVHDVCYEGCWEICSQRLQQFWARILYMLIYHRYMSILIYSWLNLLPFDHVQHDEVVVRNFTKINLFEKTNLAIKIP